MTDFRQLAARVDSAVFRVLGDDALIEGRPVQGMFASPWLAPQVGSLKTGLIEPHLIVRDSDIPDVETGHQVSVRGMTFDIVCIEPDGTGLTALILRPTA